MSLKNTIEKILSRLDKTGDCWLWTGAVGKDGYGRVTINYKVQLVHRVVYQHFKGFVPCYHDIHHKCQVKRCANPDHLEETDQKHRAYHLSQKTHCIHGHQFTPENTITRVIKGYTRRVCRACKNK